ncbi:MAG TPA: CPBP family glutamic-type intramembrane protease, partial [Chitinophagaceae bacterium]|nr:CPBP family glutamic-type intramembrane protease [Chitinophagaceae bacterium]
ESIFRLPLSLKKNALALSLGILFYIFSGKGFFKISLVDFTFYFRLIGALTVFFTFSKLISQNFLELIKKKYFKTFFFINAFLFGSVHISNYPHFNIIYFPIYFFYVLPQMVMGLALGSVQMQKGFWASVILHSLVNSISFIF